MMESIYPERGGIHEEVFLVYNEMVRRGIPVRISPYSRRGVAERGKRMLWLRQNNPSFIKGLIDDNSDVYISETAWASIPTLTASKLSGKKSLLHLHSVESKQDVGNSFVGRRVIKFLESTAHYYDRVMVPSTIEAKELGDLDNVTILPNVIDVESFRRESPFELKRPSVVFVGGMNYPPNMEAAKRIIKISKMVNEKRRAYFYLVGPNPPPVEYPVIATGYVESTAPYLLGADICIAPLVRGGGVKLKSLEYMLSGNPIIASNKAMEGIEKAEYVLANSDDEFANAILEQLTSEKAKSERNIEYVTENHSPKKAVDILLDIIKR
ncbi:hypothetical protein HS7_15100 [Sulfolobales archaeon HS-7]|nr:hypothetical protein HS7_15100 [Sulfolobales archaeon HS-7]